MKPAQLVQDRRPAFRSRAAIRIGVLAIVAVGLIGDETLAQERAGRSDVFTRGAGRALGPLFEPEFVRRDMALFDRELRLDEDQATIVETLLQDYDTAFAGALDTMRDRLGELRLEPPPGSLEQREERQKVLREMRAIRRELSEMRDRTEDDEFDGARGERLPERMQVLRDRTRQLRPASPSIAELERRRESMTTLSRQWRAERAAIRRAFMSNLQAVMNEEQLAEWPAFERALRREKSFRNARLSGEREDLFLVLRSAGYSDKDLWRIEDVLDAYAISLDTALAARDAFLDEQQVEIVAAMMAGETERAASLLERGVALRVAVRDVNAQYAEAIAARVCEEVPGPLGAEFLAGFRKRAYALVYRTTDSQRVFRAVRELDGIDNETLAAVMTLEAAYLADLAELNLQLVELTRKHEPDRDARRAERRMSWRRGDGRDGRGFGSELEHDPIEQGYERRRELGQWYRKRLESHLTPDQVAELTTHEHDVRDGLRGHDGGG